MPRQGLVLIRPILPESVQEDRVRLNVLQALQRVMTDVRRDFRRTVATWNHRVTFNISKTFTRGRRGNEAAFGITITTTDIIWGFLNEGTDVRYRRMSDDFEPKTTPGSFDSVEGRGGPAGREAMPGIEARGWSEMAVEQYERVMVIQVTNAILAGLENQRLPRRGG